MFQLFYVLLIIHSSERLVRIAAPKEDVGYLLKNGVEITQIENDFVVGAVTIDKYHWLKNRYKVDVLVDDLRALYEARAPGEDFGHYHSYQEIIDTLQIIAQNNSNICRLDTIGRSIENRLMLAIKITDNPGLEEGEPRIFFDGSTHGNEIIGTEIAFDIIKTLIRNYSADPLIRHLVNTREIWVLPILNPDGHVRRVRYNVNNVDINRDYGYMWDGWGGSRGAFSQQETQVIRDFSQKKLFVIRVSYHSGVIHIFWPWCYTGLAPQDSLAFSYLGNRYRSFTGYPAGQLFRTWGELHGGSIDYEYGIEGSKEMIVEVSNEYIPDSSLIDTICAVNRRAAIDMIKHTRFGIEGRVYDSISGQPIRAMIKTVPGEWHFYSDTNGFFHKFLLPGNYSVKFQAIGYKPKTLNVNLPSDTSVNLNTAMVPDTTPFWVFKITSCRTVDPRNNNPGMTTWILGPHDDRRFSIGVRGWIVLDMGLPIMNRPGNDFTVIEGDMNPEACSVFVSNSWNGPWNFCGFDTGTAQYDLQRAGVSQARFLRIVDDGDGDPNQPDAGFDLDAIEHRPLVGVEEEISSNSKSGAISVNLKNNPVKGKGIFSLTLPRDGPIYIWIYDVSGRLVDNPFSGVKSAGAHECIWTPRVKTGVYFYSIETPGEKRTGKLILLR